MNVVEDENYIYYLNDGSIYRMEKNSLIAQKIYDGSPGMIQISKEGDLLFMEDSTIYRMKNDGSNVEELTGNCDRIYYGDQDAIYFATVDPMYSLCRYDCATGEVNTVIEDEVRYVNMTPYGILYAPGYMNLSVSSLDTPFEDAKTIYTDGDPVHLFYSDGVLYFIGLEFREPEGTGADAILHSYDLQTKELEKLAAFETADSYHALYVKDGMLYHFHPNYPNQLDVIDLDTKEQSEITLPANDYEMLWFTEEYIFGYTSIFEDTDSRVDVIGYDGSLQQVTVEQTEEQVEASQSEESDSQAVGSSSEEETIDSHYTPSVPLPDGSRYSWFGLPDLTLEELNQLEITLEDVQTVIQEMRDMGYNEEDIHKLDQVVTLLGGTP